MGREGSKIASSKKKKKKIASSVSDVLFIEDLFVAMLEIFHHL